MSSPTTLTPQRVAALRRLTKDAPNAGVALDRLEKEMGMHRDSIRRLNRKHGFYLGGLASLKAAFNDPTLGVDTPPARPPVLGDVLATIRAKGRDKAARVAAPVAGRPLRRLYIDLEVSPNLVLSWRIGYKVSLMHENIVKERAVICAAWRWEGESKIHTLQWDKDQCDKAMLAQLIEVCAEADEIVAHNGDRFDIPWLRTRCLFHGLPPFPEVKTIDTLAWAKRLFMFNSNRLDYIARFLGLGGKLHTGFDLWKQIVLNRCVKSLTKMVIYCQRDIDLLQKVYLRLSAAGPVKTHVGVLGGLAKWTCPRTGSTNVFVSKTNVTAAGAKLYQMRNRETGTYYSINESAHREYLEAKDSAPSKVAR